MGKLISGNALNDFSARDSRADTGVQGLPRGREGLLWSWQRSQLVTGRGCPQEPASTSSGEHGAGRKPVMQPAAGTARQEPGWSCCQQFKPGINPA